MFAKFPWNSAVEYPPYRQQVKKIKKMESILPWNQFCHVRNVKNTKWFRMRIHQAHLLTIVLTSHRYTIKHIYTIIITSYRYMEDVERGAEFSFPLQSALFLVYAGRCLEWFWRDSRLFSRWIWDVFSRDTTSKDNRRCLLTVILFCFLLCWCCNGLFLVTGSIYRKH